MSAGTRGDRRTFAADVPCGSLGNFRTELYEFDEPQTIIAPSRRFWHFRWLLNFLGGSPVRNFVGNSVDAFGNKIQERLAPIWPDAKDTSGLREESRCHLLSSSWSSLTKTRRTPKKRKGADKDGSITEDEEEMPDTDQTTEKLTSAEPTRAAVPCQEHGVSTFGFIVVLMNWAFRMRVNMKWTLGHDFVQQRTLSLLRGLADTFLTDEVCFETKEACQLRLVGPRLMLQTLLRSDGGHSLRSLETTRNDDVSMHLVDVLQLLLHDENDKNLSIPRRAASAVVVSRLVEHWASVVEEGRREDRAAWMSTSVKQLLQLRTFFGGAFYSLLAARHMNTKLIHVRGNKHNHVGGAAAVQDCSRLPTSFSWFPRGDARVHW